MVVVWWWDLSEGGAGDRGPGVHLSGCQCCGYTTPSGYSGRIADAPRSPPPQLRVRWCQTRLLGRCDCDSALVILRRGIVSSNREAAPKASEHLSLSLSLPEFMIRLPLSLVVGKDQIAQASSPPVMPVLLRTPPLCFSSTEVLTGRTGCRSRSCT